MAQLGLFEATPPIVAIEVAYYINYYYYTPSRHLEYFDLVLIILPHNKFNTYTS
jgi:hypothetical protein